MLSVLFVITHRCNLRCVYCYEGDAHNEEVISADDARRAFLWVANLASHRNDKEILFTWFGGEPLVLGAKQFLELLVIQDEVFRHSFIHIRNLVQTNLTIWFDAFIPILKEYFNNSVSVSLDYNPNTRLFPNGNQSRKIVLDNVEKLKTASVKVGFVGTLTRSDLGNEAEIYQFYKKLGCPFKLNRAHCIDMTSAEIGNYLTVEEFDEMLVKLYDIFTNDRLPRALFMNYYDAVNALRSGMPRSCRLSPRQGINFALEPRGVIAKWCRFGGRIGSYYDSESYIAFANREWNAMNYPTSCLKCEYLNVVCLGACDYEATKSCEESNCGFRTESTRRQYDYVRQYLDACHVPHKLSKRVDK